MIVRSRGILSIAFALLVSCGDVAIENGRVACGPRAECPEGFGCRADGRCYRTGTALSLSCGNEQVDFNETCDPPESCAQSCEDGNNCTANLMVGQSQDCNVGCLTDVQGSCENGDGCCPSGCTNDTDDDCSADCGNSELDGGETCDPPGSCPTECNDGLACTNDFMTGSAANCNVACGATPITMCTNGDGCCPAGCTSENDADCSDTCGNEEIDDGETCDPPGSCPSTCDDVDECTIDVPIGSADNCNLDCQHTLIVDCIDDDGCCPEQCGGETHGPPTVGPTTGDNDCVPL